MANNNPKVEQLALGRGKRPKLDNETLSMRLSPLARQALEAEALRYGCIYGDKPWIAGLLTKIGNGELMIVPTPPQLPPESSPSLGAGETLSGGDVRARREERRQRLLTKVQAEPCESDLPEPDLPCPTELSSI